MRQWLRYSILDLLLKTNEENMNEINYSKIVAPINKTVANCFAFFDIMFNRIVPTSCFIFVILIFFIATLPIIGIIFLIGQLLIASILIFNWDHLIKLNRTAVESEYENEFILMEILQNVDKVIYRSQREKESNMFGERTQETIEKTFVFENSVERCNISINVVISVTVATILWVIIQNYYNKSINGSYFIMVLTVLIIYRDQINYIVPLLSDCIGFSGRTTSFLQKLNGTNFVDNIKYYEPLSLPFYRIDLDNISFAYPSNDTNTLNYLSATFNTSNHDIIGLIGISGSGKSTIAKILLKLYSITSGNIYIDGVNIDKISPSYLRENITYVSQDVKLFDRYVLENMLYGCNNIDHCNEELKRVFMYKKIKELFSDIDISAVKSGNLGEKLSGGQRQVVNIISGLINNSKILILDEPTNALDGELKWEIMNLIESYRSVKNAILIITHDKDLEKIFTNKVMI
jgi:ABC-type bacteriocin/lantibiotic exporter with double-glycine peptidase domain